MVNNSGIWYHGIWYDEGHVDDWINNINSNATHEPSSSSLCMSSSSNNNRSNNNSTNNNTMVPSSILFASNNTTTILCMYPNGTNITTTIQNHPVTNHSSTTMANNNDHGSSYEGYFVLAIFMTAMLISVCFSKYLFQKYESQQEASALSTTGDGNSNNSIHNRHNNRSIHRHRRHHSRTKMNIQEEYTRIEASLCNMYVIEHNSDYCHHQHEHDRVNDDHAHNQHVSTYKNEDDNDASDHHRPYDIESQQGEQLQYDNTKCINVSHNMSSIHSIATSCSTRSSNTNKSAGIKDDNDITMSCCHNNNECPICLNHFHIGEIVSMSPHKEDSSSTLTSSSCACQHIFHHVCIKEWLLKHNTCPSCRQVYFKDDDENMTNNNSNILINEAQHNHNMIMVESSEKSIIKKKDNNNNNKNDTNRIMFYCIRHGIGYYNIPSTRRIRSTSSGIMNQSFMFLSSSLSSLGSIHNNNPKNYQVPIAMISVPTSYELAQMRIQHDDEEQHISSSLQQQIDHDDYILRHHDDTLNNHQDTTTISNNGTTSTNLENDNNNNNDDHDDDTITVIIINNPEQNNDSRMIITTAEEITSTTIITPSSQEQHPQEQIQEDDDDQVNDDDVVVNQYHIQYSL